MLTPDQRQQIVAIANAWREKRRDYFHLKKLRKIGRAICAIFSKIPTRDWTLVMYIVKQDIDNLSTFGVRIMYALYMTHDLGCDEKLFAKMHAKFHTTYITAHTHQLTWVESSIVRERVKDPRESRHTLELVVNWTQGPIAIPDRVAAW